MNKTAAQAHAPALAMGRRWENVRAAGLAPGDRIRHDLGHGPEEALVRQVRHSGATTYLRLAEHGTVVTRGMRHDQTFQRHVPGTLIAATRPVRLCRPDWPVPAAAWLALPDGLPGLPTLSEASDEPGPVAVLLSDPGTRTVAALGPFADAAGAATVAATHHGAHLHARTVRVQPAG